jgi:hypothetical protein
MREKYTTISIGPSTKALIDSLMVGHESYEDVIIRIFSAVKSKQSQ